MSQNKYLICKFLSRKLAVFLLGFLSGIVLIAFGKLDSVASGFICTMTGVYLVGNVATGFKNSLDRKRPDTYIEEKQ
jgi:hypothetical protein